MSEREGVCKYCGTEETPHCSTTCIAALRSQLAAVREELRTSQEHEALADRDCKEMRRERDEARRESVATEMRRLHERAEALRHRAERAEAEAAYIRRAFRGAVESDALAVTYKTVGSYRAGLLKTINALDTTEPTP